MVRAVTDLSLIPTDELLEAVGARFDCYVFRGFRKTGQPTDDEQTTFAGHPLICQGLCLELIKDIQEWEQPDHEGESEDE